MMWWKSSLVPRLSPFAIVLIFEFTFKFLCECKVKGQIIKHAMRVVYTRGERAWE